MGRPWMGRDDPRWFPSSARGFGEPQLTALGSKGQLTTAIMPCGRAASVHGFPVAPFAAMDALARPVTRSQNCVGRSAGAESFRSCEVEAAFIVWWAHKLGKRASAKPGQSGGVDSPWMTALRPRRAEILRTAKHVSVKFQLRGVFLLLADDPHCNTARRRGGSASATHASRRALTFNQVRKRRSFCHVLDALASSSFSWIVLSAFSSRLNSWASRTAVPAATRRQSRLDQMGKAGVPM